MKNFSSYLLLLYSLSGLILGGCSTMGFGETKRSDISIEKISDATASIRSVRIYESPTGTTVVGSINRKTRLRYLSGHVHFDLYDSSGARLESGKATYRVRTKNRGMNKVARSSGTLESSIPQQARLVVTHHSSHDKKETLQDRLKASSSGRLNIE